jgi:hypothetical protein
MKKLTKHTANVHLHAKAHTLILLKSGRFTMQEILDDMKALCETDEDWEFIKPILLEELDIVLNNGLISCIEDGVYENVVFENEETTKSTL